MLWSNISGYHSHRCSSLSIEIMTVEIKYKDLSYSNGGQLLVEADWIHITANNSLCSHSIQSGLYCREPFLQTYWLPVFFSNCRCCNKFSKVFITLTWGQGASEFRLLLCNVFQSHNKYDFMTKLLAAFCSQARVTNAPMHRKAQKPPA